MSAEGIDYNEVASKVATSLLKDAAGSLGDLVSRIASSAKVALHLGLRNYILTITEKVGNVRTILNPQENVPTESIYVPLNYRGDRERLCTDQLIISDFNTHKHIMLLGTAGGGKSMFMRHLTISMLTNYKNILPVYFELRQINDDKSRGIVETIKDQLSSIIPHYSADIFEAEMQAGKIALILDGFDEIDYDFRDKCAKEINSLSQKYRNLRLLITSRPEEGISSLQAFRVYKVCPMSMEQTTQLLEKLSYDDEKKFAFIDRVRGGLYDRHEEFLSNPLLATMMLMTFSDVGEIPDKLTTFYQQAFEVLFQKHDRTKGVFTRRSYTQLPIHTFERILSHLCASSYTENKLVFGEAEILKYIEEAMEYEGVLAEPDLFFRDLLESTCLMQPEGLKYTFVHRSFQEYFTALFISRLAEQDLVIGLDGIIRRSMFDNVLGMVHMINPDVFEKSWARPHLKKVIERINKIDVPASTVEYFSIFFDKVMIGLPQHYGFLINGIKSEGSFLNALRNVYDYDSGYDNRDEDGSSFIAATKNDPLLKEALEGLFGKTQVEQYLLQERLEAQEFHVPIVPQEVMVMLGMDKWAAVEAKSLNELFTEIDQRVSDKSSSVKAIFKRNRPRDARAF